MPGRSPPISTGARITERGWEELPELSKFKNGDWTFPPPPHDAHVKQLTFDPRDERVVFACVEQGALLKSVDAGESWKEIIGFENREEDTVFKDCHRLVCRSSKPNEMYMTGGEGLYYTPDGGKSWEHLTRTHLAGGLPRCVLRRSL